MAKKQRLPDEEVDAETLKRREYQRQYYEDHKEEAKAYQKKYWHEYRKKRETVRPKKICPRRNIPDVYTIADIQWATPQKAATIINHILSQERELTLHKNTPGG